MAKEINKIKIIPNKIDQLANIVDKHVIQVRQQNFLDDHPALNKSSKTKNAVKTDNLANYLPINELNEAMSIITIILRVVFTKILPVIFAHVWPIFSSVLFLELVPGNIFWIMLVCFINILICSVVNEAIDRKYFGHRCFMGFPQIFGIMPAIGLASLYVNNVNINTDCWEVIVMAISTIAYPVSQLLWNVQHNDYM